MSFLSRLFCGRELPALAASCLLASAIFVSAASLEQVVLANHAPPPAEKLLTKNLAPLLHREYTAEIGEAVVDVVIAHYQQHDHPVILASLEANAFKNGTLTVQVSEGIVGNLSQRGGTHVAKVLPIFKSGQPLTGTALQRELDWINRNPFHQATLGATPGPTPDIADIEFTLTDAWPISAWANYSNDGVKPLGEDRWLAGFSVGDLLKLDQTFSFQGQIAREYDLYHAALAEWKLRLPWHHELAFNGAYVETQAPPEDGVSIQGNAWFASSRYIIPWRSNLTWHGETWLGFEAKHFDTDVFFGGDTNFRQPLDIGTFSLGSKVQRDTKANHIELVSEAVYSPGDLWGDSSDLDFSSATEGASATFFYARGSASWTHIFQSEWSVLSLVAGQWADGPMVPSEAFYLAGANAVRGYRERSIIGGKGIRGTMEGRTPFVSMPGYHAGKIQAICFADAGRTWTDMTQSQSLIAVGAGFRAQLGRWGQLRCEGAWPLTDGRDPRLLLNITLFF